MTTEPPAELPLRPIARTLDIVGERWTILILRDLVASGPRKFQDFDSDGKIGVVQEPFGTLNAK